MTFAINGWCPGALRPMLTGDGLLVRLRIRCGIVPVATALAIADCAERFGNGLIELTGRANIQLRGVSEASLPGLQARLAELELLDAGLAAEARRNVIAGPLAGVDPTALLDIRPVVAALEARISGDDGLAGLPGKFGFALADGGAFDLAGVRADVRFCAFAAPSGAAFAVFIAGHEKPVAACWPGDVAAVAAGIALEFLRSRLKQYPVPQRMRPMALAPRHWAGVVRACAPVAVALPPSMPQRLQPPLGPKSIGDFAFTGIGKPFGRWTAGEWRALAELAGEGAELRVTPWRSVLVTPERDRAGHTGAEATRTVVFQRAVLALGGILDPADPRLAIAACPGAPACKSGSTATQADALALAGMARQLAATGITLHVSGCAKGCARPEKTIATLVGGEGYYDLVLDGTARDRANLHQLDLAAAARALQALAHGENLAGNPK